jgi:hypothetical protein
MIRDKKGPRPEDRGPGDRPDALNKQEAGQQVYYTTCEQNRATCDDYKKRIILMLTSMPVEKAVWLAETMAGALEDILAYTVLRQVWPDLEPFDWKSWRAETPPPGMTWEEYDRACRDFVAGRQG